MKTAVIIGAGKGMGNAIARRFALEGFRVVLIARNKEAVESYAEEFARDGFEAHGVQADASNEAALSTALSTVMERFGTPDALIYNAAFMAGGKAGELSAGTAVEHFKVDVAGAVCAASTVIPAMKERKSGALLFTGGLFGVFPNASPDFACMSMDKAALRSLAQMLCEELKDAGVYAGIVNIMGNVGGSPRFAPEKIAEAYWQLYTDRSDFEVIYK